MKFFYEKIPELKKLKDIFEKLEHHKIKLWPSIAPDAYEYFLHMKRGNLLFKFIRFIKFVFFIEKFKIKGQGKNKITFSILIDRTDHHNIFNKIISSFNKKDVLSIDAYKSGVKNTRSIARRFWFKF